MRHFLSRSVPPFSRILVVESGSRSLLERVIEALRGAYGPGVTVDVVTCYAGPPQGLAEGSAVYRLADYGGPLGRSRLLADLRRAAYPVVAVLCSGEPIMTKWKWWLTWKLPAKVLIVNENCDWFFLDRAHSRLALHFAAFRAGLTGDEAPRTLLRIAALPFAVVYLVLFAAAVHLRRKLLR